MPTSQRTVGVAALLVLAAMGGAVLARRPRPSAPTAPALSAVPRLAEGDMLPRDPLAYVPASARTLVVADLDALRRAPATRRWFDEAISAAEPCQAALARRVRTVALVVPRLPPDEFAFVAAGDLHADELARCAHNVDVENRNGATVFMVRSRRGDGGANAATLAWTRSGVVLMGAASVLDAMLARARDVSRAEAAPLALDPLRRHTTPGAAVWALHAPSTTAPADDVLASVSGAAASLTAGEGLALAVTLRCDDSAHARQVLDALERVRASSAEQLTLPALRATVAGARADVAGADVTVRAEMGARDVTMLGDAIGELARGLGANNLAQ